MLHLDPPAVAYPSSTKLQDYSSFISTKSQPQTTERFAGVEKNKKPRKAIQTFFRTNFHNHITLSHIADNKAHIMISVNSILISIIISVAYKNKITYTNPMLMLPIIIFLLSGLVSLVFAVMSARPKVTHIKAATLDAAKRNMMYFGNFVSLTLQEYEQVMEEVLQSKDLLYGNMTRDMYYLGKVLDKKYRFLTISYNVFVVGLVAAVLAFLIAIFQ